MNSSPLYVLEKVGRQFVGAGQKLTVFQNIDLQIQSGQSLAILGASGSGKSTLLHLLASLDQPSQGKIFFKGQDISTWEQGQRARLRNKEIGLIFQFHHLLPEFTAVENIAMPGIIAGMEIEQAKQKALQSLELVGLEQRAQARVTTLSGGEMQRVSIARAMFMEPDVILADEPTGNLDEKNGEKVADLLLHLNKELNTTLIIVTHNIELAQRMQAQVELRSGELYAL